MDALGALTFLRAALAKTNTFNSEEARRATIGLVEIALQDLHPDPLPSWYFGWQALSEDGKDRIAKFVVQVIEAERGTH